MGALSYCILALFWLGATGLHLFFKVVEQLSANLDHYLDDPKGQDDNHRGDNKNEDRNSITIDDDNKTAAEDSEQQFSISDTSINLSSIPFSPCAACHEKLKALSPSSLDTNPVVELLILDPVLKSTAMDSNPVSLAEAALRSIADDLEFDISHLTQAEAEDMLVELKDLLPNDDPRACLFTKPGDTPIDKYDLQAWWGDFYLVEALKWLLHKRFPSQTSPENIEQEVEDEEEEEEEEDDEDQDEKQESCPKEIDVPQWKVEIREWLRRP